MNKSRLITGSIFAGVSAVCFVAATLILFLTMASSNSGESNGEWVALIFVIPLALLLYTGQLVTGVISLACVSKFLKCDIKPYKITAWVVLAVVIALFVTAIALIAYLYIG